MAQPNREADCRRSTAGRYRRREPEHTVLHQVVREHLETFLFRREDEGRPVPRFVERELRAFLECGILAHGFVRVHCDACGKDRVVAFSCKGRGFCPSCGGRRMADTAAWLVDGVLPIVPVRQWVLTVPFPLRFRMAYDARLTSRVLRIFVQAVFASLRRSARRYRRIPQLHGGAVTFVQRFGDALNLNVHFHTLVLDGMYEIVDGAARFLPQPPPDRDVLERVLRRIGRQVGRLLEREDPDPAASSLDDGDQPLLAGLAAASIGRRVATGRRSGREVLRRGDRIDPEDIEKSAQRADCVAGGGFSLHAGVAVPARDRRRLERLCRYMARPPVATERLSRLADGRLLYRLKHRWRDGTTHVVFEPGELLEKLVSLIPPPRAHQVRYHGVLAPCAGWRSRIVPASALRHDAPQAAQVAVATDDSVAAMPENQPSGRPSPPQRPRRPGPPGTPHRLSWAELMRRVFALDVLACPACGSRMRILAAIHDPDAVRAILTSLALQSRPPPNAPAVPQDDETFL